MKERGIKYAFISLILVMVMLLSPVAPAIRGHQVTLLWEKMMNVTPAQAEGAEESTIYLPLVIQAGEADPLAPPAFEIMSPANGGTISGMMYFAVQPTDAATLESVTFKAGSTDLGTDSDGSDGFNVFLNASNLPAGPLELSAIGTGVSGETTKRITVNVVPNPPSSATVGSEGGVLASEIGSIITLPPGAVPDGTDITVTEMTQEEITTENGFDWDAMGVTFLGAQKIESTATFSQPLGVASAGFGNRVQPGQAVVNYRIAPDADGDGVDELIVVNTASVAPNGDVISDPVPQVSLGSTATTSSFGRSSVRNLNGGISGPPGTAIEIETTGLNVYSMSGNLAMFVSESEEVHIAGDVFIDPNDNSKQIFRTVIPYLSPGPATLTIKSESTSQTSDPISLQIESLPTLTRPANEVFNEFFTQYIDAVNQETAEALENPSDENLANLVAEHGDSLVTHLDTTRSQLSDLYTLLSTTKVSEPEVQAHIDEALNHMNNGATMLEVFDVQTAISRTKQLRAGNCDDPYSKNPADILGNMISSLTFPNAVALAIGFAALAATSPATITTITVIAGAVAAIAAGHAISKAIGGLFNNVNNALESVNNRNYRHYHLKNANNQKRGSCDDKNPLTPPGPSNPGRGGTITGMGAAPPPGGNGWGNAMGGGGGSLRNPSGGGLEPGRFVIKLFSGGSPIPFSGVTDAGGYFFIPLIPEAEPFTAIAFDTMTGQTRTFSGTGLPTGQSVFMFFDFLSEGQSAGTPIEIGDVVNGEISEADEIDIYSFSAQAGQKVYFDLQDQSGISQVDWQLVDRTGTVVFDTCLGCSEPGVRTLTQGGTYTLIVGEGGNNQTGTYQFHLWNVPPPDEFAINIGDLVSDGNPAAGAGNIESPGVKDIYTFNASAGQQVYFDLQGDSGISQIDWQVVDEDGTVIFDTCLGCSEPGVHTLTLGGTYTLTVGDNRDDGFGTYQFHLWNVPAADEFSINIGDVVSDGSPAAGAGNIESPGVKDIYTFNASAGQQVYFDLQGDSGISQVDWQVVDEDGTVIFDTCLGCSEPGVHTLTRGGTYTLTVGDNRDDGFGTYQFHLWNVPAADEFSINIGDVVSDGSPAAGAGNIESPGVKDIYTFNASAGQQVYFDLQGDSGISQVDWQVVDEDGTVIFDTCLGCSEPGLHTLTRGGTYTLTVGDDRDDGFGTYSFQIIDQSQIRAENSLVPITR